MATSTTRLALRKPAGADNVNVTTDISENMDKIDAAATFERLSSFPGTPFTGKTVQRSDLDDRPYYYNSTEWLGLQPKNVYKRKVNDESLTSNTTLQNDDVLFLPVRANNTYELSGVIYYSTRSDTEFKMKWELPASAFMEWMAVGKIAGTAGTEGNVNFVRKTLGSTVTFGSAGLENTTIMGIIVQGSINILGTAGNLQLTWAQVTSNATATIVRGDSFLSLTALNPAN